MRRNPSRAYRRTYTEKGFWSEAFAIAFARNMTPSAAASQADAALEEYRKRFPVVEDPEDASEAEISKALGSMEDGPVI
jgi:hypothetical protein